MQQHPMHHHQHHQQQPYPYPPPPLSAPNTGNGAHMQQQQTPPPPSQAAQLSHVMATAASNGIFNFTASNRGNIDAFQAARAMGPGVTPLQQPTELVGPMPGHQHQQHPMHHHPHHQQPPFAYSPPPLSAPITGNGAHMQQTPSSQAAQFSHVMATAASTGLFNYGFHNAAANLGNISAFQAARAMGPGVTPHQQPNELVGPMPGHQQHPMHHHPHHQQPAFAYPPPPLSAPSTGNGAHMQQQTPPPQAAQIPHVMATAASNALFSYTAASIGNIGAFQAAPAFPVTMVFAPAAPPTSVFPTATPAEQHQQNRIMSRSSQCLSIESPPVDSDEHHNNHQRQQDNTSKENSAGAKAAAALVKQMSINEIANDKVADSAGDNNNSHNPTSAAVSDTVAVTTTAHSFHSPSPPPSVDTGPVVAPSTTASETTAVGEVNTVHPEHVQQQQNQQSQQHQHTSHAHHYSGAVFVATARGGNGGARLKTRPPQKSSSRVSTGSTGSVSTGGGGSFNNVAPFHAHKQHMGGGYGGNRYQQSSNASSTCHNHHYQQPSRVSMPAQRPPPVSSRQMHVAASRQSPVVSRPPPVSSRQMHVAASRQSPVMSRPSPVSSNPPPSHYNRSGFPSQDVRVQYQQQMIGRSGGGSRFQKQQSNRVSTGVGIVGSGGVNNLVRRSPTIIDIRCEECDSAGHNALFCPDTKKQRDQLDVFACAFQKNRWPSV